jgi:hypothetical protein
LVSQIWLHLTRALPLNKNLAKNRSGGKRALNNLKRNLSQLFYRQLSRKAFESLETNEREIVEIFAPNLLSDTTYLVLFKLLVF